MDLYTHNALVCSRETTHNYSTSFSLGVKMLSREFRYPIYAIYGFVRFADEIVDTFHEQDRKELISRFQQETFDAIERKFSSNPILHSYQWVVNKYDIDHELIKAFLRSMRMDLCPKSRNYDEQKYSKYIYGSAEVVGLMCLKVFTGSKERYEELLPSARKLGEAFQKVNFLRDIKSDLEDRNRFYFPNTDFEEFDNAAKKEIEQDIQGDFDQALVGIKMLPKGSKIGVYLAYVYYQKLFDKIKRTDAAKIIEKRYRVPNDTKMMLLISSYVKVKLGMV
jgi:phytoene/squalene synthetase